MHDSGAVATEDRTRTLATPAGRYAVLAGTALVAAGAIGLLFDASFVGAGGWQDAIHLATGILGLAAARSWARDYALGFGLAYAILGLCGLIAGDGTDLLGELPVTVPASLLHLLLGLAGLGAGAATAPAAPARRRSPA